MVVMLQREVAERAAAPGSRSYGSPSVLSSSWWDVRVIPCPAGAFRPPPKVESAVLTTPPAPTPCGGG
jgi:16S rRNA A1518/A1519 N6-dimethyltransferase RsmA/KsgA/DIM1 with predicted DNA glycosylase/AP lyase activity